MACRLRSLSSSLIVTLRSKTQPFNARHELTLIFLLLLTVCSAGVICSGGDRALAKPDAQRFRLEDGSEGTYVGVFSEDAKFRASSRLTRFLDKNTTGPSQDLRQQDVPPHRLHSYERVLEDAQPPRHAAVLPETHSLAGRALDSLVTSAYGHSRVLAAPQSVTTDSQQRVVVSDPTIPAVHILDPAHLSSFTILGGPGRRLQQPAGVAVDQDDNIYISDYARGIILVYDRYGSFLHYLGYYRGETMYEGPSGIAIDRKAGHLYVADTPRHMVLMTDLQGNLLKQMGKKWQLSGDAGLTIRRDVEPGEFNYPTEIAVGTNEVVVLDSGGTQVHIMDLACNPIGKFRVMHRANEQAVGVSIDRQGHIYISHAGDSRIEVYDQQGTLVGGFGQAGFRMGEFNGPRGLWVDATDQIHIVDSQNARIEVFRLALKTPIATPDKFAISAAGN